MEYITGHLVLLLTIFSACQGCSPGWEKHGTWCYLFSHDQMTWAEAGSTCREFESMLAEPTTSAPDAFLVKRALETRRKYWIGGSDIQKEGLFVWSSTQMAFSYTNWIPSDPNNANAGEDCVLTNWNGDGKWADGDCEWKEYFICQQEDLGNVIG